MKDTFFQIIFESPPAEVELSTELRCREIMKSNEIDKIKAFCCDLVRNQSKIDAVLQTPPIKNKLFYKFRLFIEKTKLIRQIRQHQKNHSQRA